MTNILYTDIREKDIIELMNAENMVIFNQKKSVRLFSMNGVLVTQFTSNDLSITLVDNKEIWR